jgi:hypothetical protein
VQARCQPSQSPLPVGSSSARIAAQVLAYRLCRQPTANGFGRWNNYWSVARCVRGDPYENGEGRRPKYFSKIRDSARVGKQLREQPDPAPIVFRLNIVSVIRQMAGIVRAPLKQR